MADSAQFELFAISLGLIVPHNLDEFELFRSFLFRFRSASKERLRKMYHIVQFLQAVIAHEVISVVRYCLKDIERKISHLKSIA